MGERSNHENKAWREAKASESLADPWCISPEGSTRFDDIAKKVTGDPNNGMEILAALSTRRIVGLSEADVQKSIAVALDEAGISCEREARLSDRDRIDFLVGDVGIEVKTMGSRSAVIRQLSRYAQSDDINELILASSVRRLLFAIPEEILGVTVHKHLLQGRMG